VTKERQQPHYARLYEAGDRTMLWCAYCGVKMGGNGLLRVWVTNQADVDDIHEAAKRTRPALLPAVVESTLRTAPSWAKANCRTWQLLSP
jgi:hypothetical protein